MKTITIRTWLLFTLLFLTVAFAPSQTQQQNQPDEIIRINTDLVVLDAQVLNKKTGRIVGGLKATDFLLYEDNVKQEITHFSQDKLPLSIILLLDVSGSVQPVIKQIQMGAEQALQHLKAEDDVAVMAFGTKAELIQDFTKDRKLIAAQLERVSNRDTVRHIGSATFINEGVYQAATHISRAASPISRRVIIVVTDNLSTQMPFMAHSEKQATEQLFESGSVVCGLFVRSGMAKVQNVMEKDPRRILMKKIMSMGSISTYADKTGGEVMNAKKEEVDVKLAELITHLRTRYSLGYASSNSKRDSTLRKIKLRLSPEAEKRESKPVVLTKQGYYARKLEPKPD